MSTYTQSPRCAAQAALGSVCRTLRSARLDTCRIPRNHNKAGATIALSMPGNHPSGQESSSQVGQRPPTASPNEVPVGATGGRPSTGAGLARNQQCGSNDAERVEDAALQVPQGPAGLVALGDAKAPPAAGAQGHQDAAEDAGEAGFAADNEPGIQEAVALTFSSIQISRIDSGGGEEDPLQLASPTTAPVVDDEGVPEAVPQRDLPDSIEAGGKLSAPAQQQQEEEEEGKGAEGAGQDDGGSSSESDPDYAAVLERLQWLMSSEPPSTTPQVRQDLLTSFDLAGVAELIKSGQARRIICMCGAGISVSAGIPDFRTPGSGLYHRLEQYDLPYPQAVFEIDFFRTNPRPFFLLAKELFPGTFTPTPTHYFMKLLHDKGLLLRCFTQNIDSLEHQAGLPKGAVVAAHGNFDSARCVRCDRPHSTEHVRQAVFAGEGTPCYCTHPGCGGLVKPDIVFFGENLPERFWDLVPSDFPAADLLIVMGTSLVVQPFASLIDRVGDDTPRLLINRERAGEVDPLLRASGYRRGFNFSQGNYRDALFEGECDAGVRELCRLLGWEGELEELMKRGGGGIPPPKAIA